MKLSEHARRRMRRTLCHIGARLGIEIKLKTMQRKVLEQTIIPCYVARNDVKKILFVGCEYYTNHYWKFFRDKEFWTIEPDPWKKYFGSRNHVIDKLENLHLHFQHDYFDLIICNGVFGWGLNTKEQCEIAFRNCYNSLREGGEFILGWDDVPSCTKYVSLKEIESLAMFRRQSLSPLSTWRYLVESPARHTYDFYFKSISK